jgi:hypothetical protein
MWLKASRSTGLVCMAVISDGGDPGKRPDVVHGRREFLLVETAKAQLGCGAGVADTQP